MLLKGLPKELWHIRVVSLKGVGRSGVVKDHIKCTISITIVEIVDRSDARVD